MKKLLKTQAKRSLSLMLTLVMLMSCLVCAAPALAEALEKEVEGTQSEPSYKVELIYDIGDSCTGNACPEDSELTVTYAPDLNDLTKTETAKLDTGKLGDADGKTGQSQSLTVKGFPTAVTFWVNGGGTATVCDVTVHEIRINGVSVIDYANAPGTRYGFGNGDNQTVTWAPDYDTDSTGATGMVNGTSGYKTWKWKKPSASFDTTNLKDITLTMPKVTGSENKASVASTSFSSTVKDSNYNTYWSSAPTYFLATSSTAAQATDFGEAFGLTKSGSGAYITLTEDLQKSYAPNATDASGKPYRDFYLRAFVTSSINTHKTVKVYYPRYDWQFDATVQGSGDSKANIIMKDNSIWDNGNGAFNKTEYLAYGQKAENYPVDAQKEGYTFYGFWTEKQPKQPDSLVDGTRPDPFVLEENFRQPIDSNTYDTLTDDLKTKYYPAGVKWDPKSDSSQLNTEGDKKYYGWWLSDDINVKFYDIDGKFLGAKAVKHGQKNGDITWPAPKSEQTVDKNYTNGALTYSNWNGKWENIDGEVVASNNYTFTHDLILTPMYDTVTSDYKYDVTFNKTFGTFGDPYSGEYTYRTEANVPTDGIGTIAADDAYTYEFEGWAVSTPISGNYHIIEEDGDFDTAGNAVNLVSDFTVRSDVTYYPVFRRFIRSYDVTFNYKDSTGADKTAIKNFKYGERITAPDGIPTEWAAGGYGYSFLGWTKGGADVNLNAETCVPGLTYTAKYSEGVATPYTVTFEYRNENGELVTKEAQVNHGQKITQETVNSLAPAENYDNGEALVTYNGVWEYNGTRYNTADLTSFSPESHVTFTAVYENPQPFYTVTYVDGNTKKEYRVITGTTLPFWKYETTEDGATVEKEYLPTRENTEDGSYEFTGWFDAQEGGTQYIPGETSVTGNVTLYPQFSYDRFTYNIVFMNYDGTKELAKGTFYYGDELKDIIRAAESSARGAEIKPADDTYSYQFLGWDKRVPEFCEGGEPGSTAVFTAQYKPVYIYYNVEWYNDAEATAPLYISKYIYGDKIYTPAVELDVPENEGGTNQEYVFKGWFYKVGGTEYQYERGMILEKDIMTDGIVKMYAKYELTDKTYTVTVNDGSGKPYTLTVKEGDTIAALISDPADGYVDETYHREFTGWTTVAGEGEVAFDVNAPITADITITAKFIQSEHVLNKQEVTEVPTYPMASYTDFDGTVVPADDGTGSYAKWCECDKDKTYDESEEYIIPALTDEVAPSGTAYIGTQWKTGDELADGEVIYANGKTTFIITTSDKGDVNATYNATGLGIGVQKIEVKVDGLNENYAEVYNWTSIQAALIEHYEGWNNVPSMYQNYNANVALNAGDYAFEDGKTYTIHAKITDKAGNVSELTTVSFVYDTTAPAVELDGDSNVAGDVFCEEVIVKVNEANNYTITANGAEIAPALDENDVAIEDTYVIDAAGKYQIVVTDGAGGKATVFVEVLEEHNTVDYKVEATCLEDGVESKKCTNCGEEFDEKVIEALDHDWKDTIVAATCTEHGYIERACTRCDNPGERQYYETNENGEIVKDEEGNEVLLDPATGHTYDTDLDGEVDEGIVGEITKAATCKATGTIKYTCEICDETKTETIAIDENAHNFYNPVTKKPTCTEAGQVSVTCKLCRETVILLQGADAEAENYDPAYAPKGHTTSTDYKVITKATCAADGSQTLYCTVCNVNIGTPVAISKTTVAHTWHIADPETDVVAPTETTKGYTVYTCSVCGAKQNGDYVDVLTKYTVTFYNEDGSVAYEAAEVKGTTIAAEAVADPTKANSEDGKHKYTFMGWYTKKADGSYDKKYGLPMTVSEDLKLYARFNEEVIIYTIEFVAPTGFDEVANADGTTSVQFKGEDKKELIGAIGEVRKPAATPTLKGNAKYTFEFDKWVRANAAVGAGENFTIDGDATYEAQFKIITKTVGVIFMNGNEAIYKAEVKVGGSAAYDATEYGTPEKAYDDAYHYAFDGKWYEDAACTKEATLTNVTSTKTVYAGFIATAHDWKETNTEEASCTVAGKVDYKCEACEATKSETLPTLDHTPADAPEYNPENGMMETKCTECGTVISSVVASSTITFLNDGGARLDRIPVKTGETFYEEAAEIEKKAVKKTDEQNSYTFAGWVLQGTTAPVYKSSELPKADADAVYVATYTATARKYTVSFATADNAIKYSVEVVYGEKVEYTYTEELFGKPEANANGHYVFDKWDKDTSNVTSDILVRPIFKQIAHSYVESGESGATCTQGGGRLHECSVCGYSYVEGYESALGHKWKVVGETAPDYANGVSGTRYYKCDRCGEEKTEEIPAILTAINVTVKDQYGAPVSGATVRLYVKSATGEYEFTGLAEKTNANGIVTFMAQPGKYRVFVVADGMGEVYYDVTVDESGNISSSQGDVTLQKPEVDNSCSCTCHKSTFWGAIFRFFQKIVKLFTGKPSCCAEPDSRI